MPIVKKLVPVDGRLGVVLDVPATDTGSVTILTDEEVEAIRQAEREECALLAERVVGDFERDTPGRTEGATRQGIAAAIRARSNSSN